MRRLVIALLAPTLSFAVDTISITSPANNAVITSINTPITVAISAPALDRVEYTFDGKLCDTCVVHSAPWGFPFYASLNGDVTTAIVAKAKDVFGNVLATSSTVTVTTKLLGPTIFFAQEPATSGTSTVVAGVNHPYASPSTNYTTISVDGRTDGIADGWGSDWGTVSNPITPPPYGRALNFISTRFFNGPHEISLLNAKIPGSAGTGTITFATTDVNTTAETITLPYHPLSPVQGFTLTTTGTLPAPLATSTTYYALYTDRDTIQVSATQNGSAINLTSQGSGTHTVNYTIVSTLWCETAGAGCVQSGSGAYYPFSTKRITVTFANGAAAMEMRPPWQDCFLTPSGTCSAAPSVMNTDGTTTAVTATVPTYTLNTEGGVSGCVTVNSSGLITAASTLPASPCYANVTVSCSSGACNGLAPVTVRVMAQTTNIFKHFSHSGQVLTAYDPAQSFIPRAQLGFGSTQINLGWGAQEMKNSGINMIYDSIPAFSGGFGGGAITACSTPYNEWRAYYDSMLSTAQANSLYFWLVNFNMTWAPWLLSNITNDIAFDRHACIQSMLNDMVADGQTTFLFMQDEIDGILGSDPTPATGRTVGGSQFTNIVASSGTCTYNGTLNARLFVWDQASGGGDSTWVTITGATTSGLNGPHLVTGVTEAAPVYQTTAFTFACSAANGTYNASNNAGMQVVMWPFSATFGASTRCQIPGTETHYTGINDVPTYTWTGFHPITSIVVSGGVATLNWTGHGIPNGRTIRIWSATNTNLHTVATFTSTGANTGTIPTLAANGTYNSGTDPNLYVTMDCGFSNTVLSDFMGTAMNVAGRPAAIAPIIGGAYNVDRPWQVPGWMNNSVVADGAFIYSPGQPPQLPIPTYGADQSAFQMLTDHIAPFITMRAYEREPRIALDTALNGDYSKQSPGFQLNIAGGDHPQALYGNNAMIAAKAMWPVAMGAVGKLNYVYGGNPADTYTTAVNNPVSSGVRHYVSPEKWRAIALVNQLIKRLEKYLLQPRENTPYYGPTMYTAARTGSYGDLLLIGSLNEMPYPSYGAMTVDLTNCRQSGGSVNRYRLDPTRLTLKAEILSSNPSSDSITFAPGEIVAYTCQVAGTSDLTSLTFPTPSLPAGSTKMAVKVNYYPGAVDEADAVDCTSGCTLTVHEPAWFKRFNLGSDNSIKAPSDPTVIQ